MQIWSDLRIIFQFYISTWIWWLAGWPLAKKWFSEMEDGGMGVSRIIGALLAALLVWQFGYLGIPANTDLGIKIIFGALAMWGLTQIKNIKFKKEWLVTELIFVVGLFGISIIRGFMPEIGSLEKFMDFGFINRYLQSPTLPAEDMWMAGQSINYYSFGHFWSAVLIRLSSVTPTVGYNLMLGTVFGLAGSLCYLVIMQLAGKLNIRSKRLGAIMGTLMVMVGGNTHTLWYILTNNSLKNYWYADATRFIHNTIHEFPGYSFVVSDLHGHVLDLPVVMLLILCLQVWWRKRDWWLAYFIGGLFGVMLMTNTWDVAIYGMVFLILCVFGLKDKRFTVNELMWELMMMILGGVSVASLWWIGFRQISDGIGIVKERSPWWQLAALWSGGVFMVGVSVLANWKSKHKWLIRGAALGAILLLILPELIYARDIYPDHPRANTMFKLTYQAFILMGILGGAAIAKLIDKSCKWPMVLRSGLLFWTGIFFSGQMIFPFQSFPSYYGDFKNYQGLDGMMWLKTEDKDKYEVARWLNNKSGRMVEAVGDSYTHLNAVSVFSGRPTIVGWRVHEWLWRGGFDIVGEKEREVMEIYSGSVLEKKKEVLKKYQIKWVWVGKDEKEKYSNLDDKLIKKLGKVVWKSDDSYLIEVTEY